MFPALLFVVEIEQASGSGRTAYVQAHRELDEAHE